MAGNLERFRNIEFIRFLGSLCIALEHFVTVPAAMCIPVISQVPLYEKLISNMSYGWIWLHFFFVMSGFFLFNLTNFNSSYIAFAKKKFARLVPVIAFFLAIYMILSWFHILKWFKYTNIYALLLLNSVGLSTHTGAGNIGGTWYASSLFWGMSFYFYLKKLLSEKWFSFITALTVLFSYVAHINLGGIYNVTHYGFINNGILHALGGLGVGYFIALAWKEYKLTEHKNTLLKSIIATSLEVYLLIFLIKKSMLSHFEYGNYTIFILAFVGLFWLFLTKEGYLSRLLDNNFSQFIGKYAYSIFIGHTLVMNLYSKYIVLGYTSWVVAHPILNLVIPTIIALLLGVFAYHFVEKPSYDFFKVKIKKAEKDMHKTKEKLMISKLPHTWILDVDGTIVKHNGYKIDGYDTLLDGVKEFFETLSIEDKVILLTARKEQYLEGLKEFLKENNLRYDYLLTNMPMGERILVNDRKPSGLNTAFSVNKDRDIKLDINYKINEEL